MDRQVTRRRLSGPSRRSGAGPFVIIRPGGPSGADQARDRGATERAGEVYRRQQHAAFPVRRGARERGGGVLGRTLEVVVADSELKPDVATRRANDLVLGDKVDVLVVNTGSNIAKAVSQVATQHRKVFCSTGTEARELTGEEFFETTFRCCLNTDMHSGELAVYFSRLAPRKYGNSTC